MSKIVRKSQVDASSQLLLEATKDWHTLPPLPLSKRLQVAQLYEKIEMAIDLGYRYTHISRMLKDENIIISANLLSKYYRNIRDMREATSTAYLEAVPDSNPAEVEPVVASTRYRYRDTAALKRIRFKARNRDRSKS